jgi:purine-nucleoside phosphorylase
MTILDQLKTSIDYIRSVSDHQPTIGIILGSGLAKMTTEITIEKEIEYASIPHFPLATVKGHKSKLIFGSIGDKKVVCLSGRFHYYEGYSMTQVTYPVRVMKMLGITHLIVSNASGGLNPNQEIGDLMIIKDHINLQPEHPLRGKNYEELGPRFPDMMHTYAPDMVEMGMAIAKENNYRCETGVYVGVQGPTFETPSEYKYFHLIGGDAVGMSTVPEVIIAKHSGLKVFGISVISDLGYPANRMQEINHDFVLKMAAEAEPKMTKLVKTLVERL